MTLSLTRLIFARQGTLQLTPQLGVAGIALFGGCEGDGHVVERGLLHHEIQAPTFLPERQVETSGTLAKGCERVENGQPIYVDGMDA